MGTYVAIFGSSSRSKSVKLNNMESELVRTFAFHGGLVLFKTVLMSPLTGFHRIKNSTYANLEDLPLGNKSHVEFNDVQVERIRRAQQNDIENVVPFILIGGLYLTTNPSLATSKILFRVFVAARFAHTFFYLGSVRQPCRFLAFLVGLGVNSFMAINVLSRYLEDF